MISIPRPSATTVLLFAVLLLASVMTVTATGAGTDGKPADRTFNVTIERSSNSGSDAKPRGESASDTWQAAGRVFENGTPVGRVELSVTLLDPRYKASMQVGVLALADGSVMFQGVGVSKKVPNTQLTASTNTYAIVGGTGAYAGAGGTLEVRAAGKDPAKSVGVLTFR